MIRKSLITTILALLCLVVFAGVCFGDKIEAPVSNWKQTEFQGRISYISPAGDYIIASERKVVLVDMRHNMKHYETNILDVNGREISFSELEKDSWVFVRGGMLEGGLIGARTIYLLPEQLNEKTMKKEYPELKRLQVWGK